MQQQVNKAHLVAMYLSAFSMLVLAGALLYFAISLMDVARQIPGILQTVEHTSEQIGPVIDDVGEIIGLVPPILKEIEATRKLVKPALDEYAKTNQQLPRILDEIEATRQTLPEVLKTVDGASTAVISISREIEATRPLIPQVLSEVEKTRESIPPMLDHADQLIANARDAGKEASKGAVSGVFSGILMAPFEFVGDVGKRLVGAGSKDEKKLSSDDYALVEKATHELLELGKKGDERTWSNADSGNSGILKLVDIYDDMTEERECRELTITVRDKKEVINSNNIVLCRPSGGKWDFK